MKRSLSLAAVVVLVGLVLWFTRGLTSEDSAAADAASPGSIASEHRDAATSEFSALDAPEELATRAPDAAQEDLERANSDRAAVDAANAPSRSVRAVDAQDLAPVAGAVVRYVALDGVATAEAHPAWDFDQCDAWLEKHGRSAMTAADGLARLDVSPRRACIVVVSAPDRFGRALLAREADDSKNPTAEVALAPDGEFRVLTLGSDGAPIAGAPVVVRSHMQRNGVTKIRLTSDGQGAATFKHVLVRPLPVALGDGVAVDGLLDASLEVALDPRALPVDPIVLRLPPTGGVDVHVRAGSDTRSSEPGRVEVWEAVGAEGEIPSLWSRHSTVSATLVDGRALLPWIGLGKELDVSVSRAGASQATTVRTRGPVALGEVVQVEVTLGADHPILRVRVVDAAGAPIADTQIRATVSTPTFGMPPRGFVQPKTDAAGVLLIDLPKGQGADVANHVRLEHQRAGVELIGRLEAPRGLTPGIVDLGDIVLREAPVIVAGRVVDENGAIVAGADVRLRIWPTEGEWIHDDEDAGRATLSGEDGSFVLRGELERAALQLSAKLGDSMSEDVSCEVGATGVVLELRPGSSICGRVLTDGALAPEKLSITLEPEFDELSESGLDTFRLALENDGAFRSGALRPGRYTLLLQSSAYGLELVRMEGVEAPPGRPSPDPRLVEIDLRGRVIAIELELATPAPTDRVVGLYSVRRMDSNGEWSEPQRQFLQERKFRLDVVASQVDLSISAQGFRTVELKNVRGAQRVTLERGPRVRLILPPDVELPSPPQYLKAFLSEVGDEASMLGHFQELVFGPERELTLFAPGAGTLDVRWLIEIRMDHGLSTTSLDLDPPQKLEILDVAGEQLFEVIAPVEQLAEWLERQKN